MKRKLLCKLFIFLPLLSHAQSTTFKVLPFLNGVTSIKDGQIEAGPEFNWDKKNRGKTFTIRPLVRVPLTNKSDNSLQIDRFSSTWRGVLALLYTKDKTTATGSIKRYTFSGQFEYGSAEFKYYPTGDKSNEMKPNESSYAFELKYIGFRSKGAAFAAQFSPQFRLRYSYDWKASDAVGVVQPATGSGVVTTKDLVIDAPTDKATFSPAFSLQFYPGKGNFSYGPTVYYDFTGAKAKNDPFNNLNRLRIEAWVFFYPLIAGNVKIGLTPTLSIRTVGTDDFNQTEFGGQITLKFGTTFLQFL